MKLSWVPESCIYSSSSECLERASADAATAMVSSHDYNILLAQAEAMAKTLEIFDVIHFTDSGASCVFVSEAAYKTLEAWQKFKELT